MRRRNVPHQLQRLLGRQKSAPGLYGQVPLWDMPTLLSETQASLDRSGHCAIATVALNIEKFDSRLGKSGTQALASAAAARLARALREGDGVTSTGPGRFALLFTDLDAPHDAWTVADRLTGEVRRVFNIDNEMVTLAANVAVVAGRGDGQTAQDLLAAAESALEDVLMPDGLQLTVLG